jgi:urocanate hydratase
MAPHGAGFQGGVVRHADAGDDVAIERARSRGLNLPGILG